MTLHGWAAPTPNRLQFAGRFKTVTQKQVSYNRRKLDDVLTVAAIVGGAGVLAGLPVSMSLFPTPVVQSLWIPAATVGAVSAGATPAVLIHARRVDKTEKQIPLTPEEEWALMTPLERAQSELEKGLSMWEKARSDQYASLERIRATTQTLREEMEAMASQVMPSEQPPSVLDVQGQKTHREQRQKQMQLEAKQKVLKDQERLLEAVTQIYTNLDQEIQKREAILYQTREQLKLMAQQEMAVNMHQKLEMVKGQTTVLPDQAGEKPSKMAYDIECQRVRLEELMKEITLACDVNQVLVEYASPQKLPHPLNIQA